VEKGWGGPVPIIQGRLHVGKAMAPPLIRSVLAQAEGHETIILDAPPGTSCSVVAVVMASDYVVLVTEPTPFGLHDLSLAVEMVKMMGVPFSVVINRSDIGDDSVSAFCRDQDIDILLEIPNDRQVAEAYSRGEPAVKALPEMHSLFQTLYHRIEKAVSSGSRVAV
jgi:MinD superfamily P-loop ATPase